MSGTIVVDEKNFKEKITETGLFCQFDPDNGVLFLDVKQFLTSEDFCEIEEIINPYFQEHGELRGVIVNSRKFPYWKGAQNRQEYIAFAQNNHRKFKKAAFLMSGFFVKIILRIAKGRVHPEIKLFKYNKVENAFDWVLFNILKN